VATAPTDPAARSDTSYTPGRRFWALEVPAATVPPPDGGGAAVAGGAGPVDVEPLTGVRLAPGVLLVLPAAPSPDDLTALAEAARPLLAHLIDRGLIPGPAWPAEPTEGAHR